MAQFPSKDSSILARQLEAQRVVVEANLVAGSSDLPSNVAIANGTIAATVITLTVSEVLKKCFGVSVKNRATGATIALAAAPDLSVAQKISVTVDGTAQSDVVIEFIYAVA